MKIQKIIFIALWTCGLTSACTQTEEGLTPDSPDKIARIVATIGESIESRANLNKNDGLSYSSFAKGDLIGFYATGGLSAQNMQLTYDGGFSNSELKWTDGSAKNLFAYFPYPTETIAASRDNSPTSITICKDKKFIDILTCSKGEVAEGNIISLGFGHRFAILAFTRGTGFEGKDERMRITLNKKVAQTATFTYNTGNNATNDLALTADNASGINEVKTTKTDNIEYVIVPAGTIDDGSSINIASITLTNNAGREITINYSIEGGLKSNYKYPITVMMKDNNAVVSPSEIIRWDEEIVDIKEPAGIKTPADLHNWAAAYNATSQDENTLAQFGTKDNESNKWTFLLLDDINFTTTSKDASTEAFNGITAFKDIFDGQGHAIIGLSIKESEINSEQPLGFVRTLKETGAITRLILHNITFDCRGKGSAGAFAGAAEAGSSISKCSVTGNSIIYGATAGAIIGGGTCTLSDNKVASGVGVFSSSQTND